MKKSKVSLVLTVFGALVAIFCMLFVIVPIVLVSAMTMGAENRVRDIDKGTAHQSIQEFRISLLQKSDEGTFSSGTTGVSHIRLVNYPTFSGSFGVGYLSYSVLESARSVELLSWQRVEVDAKPVQNTALKSIVERNDRPPWWPAHESELVYVGTFWGGVELPFEARDISVWISRENATFYAFFSFGH